MARLVAIGDSLAQGFQSLAVCNTRFSFPALIAERMGLDTHEFAVPNFSGCGGLPLNIEWLARRLEDRYGANLSAFDWLRSVHSIVELIDEVEDYWERGKGGLPAADELYHNLAVWGFEAADAYNLSAEHCQTHAAASKDNWFAPPSQPRCRTAARVLNPARLSERRRDTQIGVARRIKERDGAIDHLLVVLGANNCLGTVVTLEVAKTGTAPPGPESGCTLWTPEAFAVEYERLAAEIAEIGATHVYLATVPHVTIPPVTRGVMEDRGRLPLGRRYFDYYTRFFIHDKEFDPERDPFLNGDQAQEIDRHIDAYNRSIRAIADACGWQIVDLCDLLDQLAVRRNHGTPRFELPPALADLSIRFFEIHPDGALKNGGLISLDGVHPTLCGYALIAQRFIEAMRENDSSIRDIDFEAIRRWDPLVTKPPRTLDDMFTMLQTLERYFHLSRWMSPHL